MLIIFDLDDTLIDTSGCIIPIKLEDALKSMMQKGLAIPDFDQALELLKRLNSSSESSKRSLAEFLEIVGGGEHFLEVGVQEVYENVSPDLPIFPLDHALEVLNDLSRDHQLALVTIGVPSQQMGKLKKAGIDSGVFSKIAVTEEGGKKAHYLSIVEELSYNPSEVVVCGDRIATDLSPAKELGLKTIHMRCGRGLNSSGLKSDVDYSIGKLSEIKEIIASLYPK